MQVIIPRDTEIPTKRKVMWTIEADYQKKISLYEGARSEFAVNNFLIGVIDVTSIVPPTGHIHIDLEIEVSMNGVYKLTASTRHGELSYIIPNNQDVDDIK